MMKVCHISDSLRPGIGLTQVILDLMRCDTIVTKCLYIGTGIIDARFPECSIVRLTPDKVNLAVFARYFLGFSILLSLKREDYRVLHVHTRKGDYLCVIGKILGYKILRTQHVTYDENVTSKQPFKKATLRRFRNILLQRNWWIDRWVGVSETAKHYIMQRWDVPASKIEVIYNGIDVDKFTPLCLKLKNDLRRHYGWSEEWTVCLMVGALVPRKRYLELLDTFELICRSNRAVRIVIVGEGSLHNQVESKIHSLNLSENIVLLGLRDDVSELMKSADIFVHGAVGEAFGLVIAEAMSSGLPVIAIRGQGPAEIIQNGIDGILVENASSENYALALLPLIRDHKLRAILGHSAQESAGSNFSVDRMLSNYAEQYANLIMHSPKSL